MFSTVSRKLKGKSKSGGPIQLLTPSQFDDFLSKVFLDHVPVKRIHVVADMGQFFESSKNEHTRGLGHQGWRPGHVLKSQRVRYLERLKTKDPNLYNEMVRTNSLVIPEATADFVLEDMEVLRAMCSGHDGKNPNHVIRFVWCPVRNRSVVQYKHFCFDEAWRPTMTFNRESGRWETNADVTYSWFNELADLKRLAESVAKPKTVSKKNVDPTVVDHIAMCVGSMANFSLEIFEEWKKYFDLIKALMSNPVCDIPILSARQLADRVRTTPSLPFHASVEPDKEGSIQLTSVLHTNDRETLVCSNQIDATAWSNDMMDTRETARLVRTSVEGEKIWDILIEGYERRE